uniref:G_PROTEIN_RECEP_F1_2 domain-containing protein n=1 Tax=Syphacia muris TaxID=451379 RepID=A0A0N5AQX7_9BILA
MLSQNQKAHMPFPLLILFTVIASIIIVLTILGNLLVLCFKARVGRTNTTLFVWNLGLTDFLVGIFVLPLGVLHIVSNEWLFGRTLCRLWVAADVTFCTCSVVTICVISADRYLAVTRPLRYKSTITKTKVVCMIIIIWLFSISVLLATVRWSQPDNFTETRCFVGNEILYLAHSVVFAFFLPAAVTLTLYWRIYELARNRQKALDRGFLMILGHNMNFLTNTITQQTFLRVHTGKANGMFEQQRRVLRTHERIAKTLGVVSCSFLFCWLPFFTLYLTNNHCDCIPTNLIEIASWLGYCNSMLNPVIYSFTIKEFKKSAIRLILPPWRGLHRLCKFIPPPDEHYALRISRCGAKARFESAEASKLGLQRRGHQNSDLFSKRHNNVSDGSSAVVINEKCSNCALSAADSVCSNKLDPIQQQQQLKQQQQCRHLLRATRANTEKRKMSINDITCIMLTKRTSSEHSKCIK